MLVRQLQRAIFSILITAHSHAIFNGDKAEADQAPHAVYLWSLTENKISYRCSGTIIAPDVIVTETSCIYDDNNKKKGQTILVSHSQTYDTSKPLSHLLKDVSATVRGDARHPDENLILLFLNQALSFEPAVVVQPKEVGFLLGVQKATIVGWGYFEKPPSDTNTFPSFNFFQPKDERQIGTKHIGESKLGTINSRFIELGHTLQDATSCQGDEGGPITITLDEEKPFKERLIGIISTNSNLKTCQKPTLGLRLDVLAPFIQKEMEKACQKNIRTWCDIQGLPKPTQNEDPFKKIYEEPFLKLFEDRNLFRKEPNPPKIGSLSSDQETPASHPFKKMDQADTVTRPVKKKGPSVKLEGVGCHCSQI